MYSKDKATLISCPAGKTDNISIPEGVVSISSGAFKQGKLSSVTIPKTVTSIGEGAFDGCENLTTMTCLNTTPPTIVGDWAFYWELLYNGTLYVPDNSVDTYRDSSGWNGFSNIREISTSAINDIMVNTDSQTNGSHTMTVYDLAGRKLPNGSLSQLPKGIYIVKTGSKTTKVVIK
ncbi:MAG: leucine-rich repeat domain-containing protein [Bacteroidales bacterium]|nr:leucine-rich repeat domain-containing protein [Bacteroidales bacterium]MDD7724908.1 leucine-rich repeat domain-containing protein [Bacteroidales bacterium]